MSALSNSLKRLRHACETRHIPFATRRSAETRGPGTPPRWLTVQYGDEGQTWNDDDGDTAVAFVDEVLALVRRKWRLSKRGRGPHNTRAAREAKQALLAAEQAKARAA